MRSSAIVIVDGSVKEQDLEQAVEELLAPYDEDLETGRSILMTREQAIKEARDELNRIKNTNYALWLADPAGYEAKAVPEHIQYLKDEFLKELNGTDDELWKRTAEDYPEEDIDEAGNIYTDSNPVGYWDYWYIGGFEKGKPGPINVSLKNPGRNYIRRQDLEYIPTPYALVTKEGQWLTRYTFDHEDPYSDEALSEWQEAFNDHIMETVGSDWLVAVLYHC